MIRRMEGVLLTRLPEQPVWPWIKIVLYRRLLHIESLMQNSIAIPSESEELMDEDGIVIEEGEIVRKEINGVISIDFSERILPLVEKSLEHTVVVKLLGRRIGYNTLRNKIYELWKPSQPIKLMDIVNDYFLVSFRAHLDYT
ncbi:hypothetical protein V6N11_025924 [Hibiscus sabdariffa]|uniref:DUF4283 domain-containing protein n=1 Tax=Hibiscus sabdariffa TaxID=183260 RepID=A0ABR2SV19_9ROSI